jgi:hypothetical protein
MSQRAVFKDTDYTDFTEKKGFIRVCLCNPSNPCTKKDLRNALSGVIL